MTGDSTKATKIEVIADAKKVTWNGRKVAVTQAPRPVELPELTTWKYKEEAPESAPGFDDSPWTTADHLTANNPELAGSLPVLAMDEYGYHHGDVWYRGRFTATGKATGARAERQHRPDRPVRGLAQRPLPRRSGDGAHTFDIPAGTLKAAESADNVLSVLVENAGHNEEWGHDYSKEPRGLLGAEVVGGASHRSPGRSRAAAAASTPSTPSRARTTTAGCTGSAPAGPCRVSPTATGRTTTALRQTAKTGPGVRWYRTSARLDLPQGQDNAIALDLADDPRAAAPATAPRSSSTAG